MSFDSPLWLLGLLAIPIALLAYVAFRSRATRYAVRFPAVATLREALPAASTWRHHIPTALALVALAALVVALARPHRTIQVASQQEQVMLVLDHSGSMNSQDVSPTRLIAAKTSADNFINHLPPGIRVGAVTFSSSADSVQPPSADHSAAQGVVDSQVAEGATATGDALDIAVSLLHQGDKPPPGSIVLLSDGAANAGRDPLTIAHQAAADKIPIYTIALGTPGGTLANPDPLGPPQVGVPPDPQLMASIARASGGRSFKAEDATTLSAIYKRLGSRLGTRPKRQEITAAFAVGGLLLLIAAGLTALRWAPRLP